MKFVQDREGISNAMTQIRYLFVSCNASPIFPITNETILAKPCTSSILELCLMLYHLRQITKLVQQSLHAFGMDDLSVVIVDSGLLAKIHD